MISWRKSTRSSASLQVEIEALGYFAGLDHRLMLFCTGFLKFFEIGGFRFSEHPFDFGVGFETGLAHAQIHQCTHKCDLADIVTGRGFDGDNVAYLKRQIGRVLVKSLAGILELHFHHVAVGVTAGYVVEPVERV